MLRPFLLANTGLLFLVFVLFHYQIWYNIHKRYYINFYNGTDGANIKT